MAAELRRLVDGLAVTDLGADQLVVLAGRLRAAGDALASGTSSTRWARHLTAAASSHQPTTAAKIQVHHPLYAGESGTFPPLHTEIELPRLNAETTFGEAYEGPPGLVHGGYLAAGFDMVLSHLALHVLDHSVTRWLRFRYLGPTFLHQTVRYEVEADEPHGRLVSLRGRLLVDGRLTMRAEAQFVAMDLARFVDRGSTMRQ